jgi:hypothetical protein
MLPYGCRSPRHGHQMMQTGSPFHGGINTPSRRLRFGVSQGTKKRTARPCRPA